MRRSADPAMWAVGFITAVALAIRLAAVSSAAFPLNDGGLFYTMISDLISNGLALPALSTYNGIGAPFAYPPLAFYLYGLVHQLARMPLTELLRYGPAIVSAACIPAFYSLARTVLRSDTPAVLATLVFAMVPRAFDWLIMGGGVTRSLGLLFALLATRQAYLLCQSPTFARTIPLIATSSLVVYTHPEATTHTAITAAVFVLLLRPHRRLLLWCAVAAVGIALVTAPWWGNVLARHGLDPFLAAAAAAREDSYNTLVGIFALFRFEFADEPYLTLMSALCLVGVASELSRRRYLLPVWLVAMHTIEPRGAPLFMMIPFSMCAGIAVVEVILPALGTNRWTQVNQSLDLRSIVTSRASALLLGFLFVYGAMASYSTAIRIRDAFTLSPADLEAMQWVRQSTLTDGTFALVSQGLPLRDATAEWFPALTTRRSVATVFGYEWIRSVAFSSRLELYRSLQTCAAESAACLKGWEEKHGIHVDYIYLRDPLDAGHLPLAMDLSASRSFQMIYNSTTVIIYRQVPLDQP